MLLPIINVWKERSLIFYLSLMNIKLRYKGTFLNLLWTGLEPLLYFLVLYVVFTSIRSNPKEDFAIYLIFGVMLYHLFVKGTTGGLSSLRQNGMILKSLNIKKEIFPVVSTLSVTILMFVELGIFFGLMLIFEFIPQWTTLFLPFLMILFLLLVLGVSYHLSIINVFFKDIQPIWSVFSHALLFISPIFWYLDDTHGILLDIHKINPLGQLIEIGHKIIFNASLSLDEWLYSTMIVLVILFSGYFLFQKYSPKSTEKI